MQLGLVAALLALVAWACANVAANTAQRNLGFSLDFLRQPMGVDLSLHLIAWDLSDSYARALLAAVLNTLFAAVAGVGLATLLGLMLGLMRLSGNPLAGGTAYALVEVVRSIPALTHVVFWYLGVLAVLPPPRASLRLAEGVFLNARGLLVPMPRGDAWQVAATVLLLGIAVSWMVRPLRRRPVLACLYTLAGSAVLVLVVPWDQPRLRGFNFVGGTRLTPEFLALWLGISIYTSAFIAEIVRSAIASIPQAQVEAALSLGLRPSQSMRLVVLPQALRVMLPPLTSQYLNVVKATTLGAAIAYPEVVEVFAHTALNQTGRTIEIMGLILAVFLGINLVVSAAMGVWARGMAKVG